jgi:hypothetical protein
MKSRFYTLSLWSSVALAACLLVLAGGLVSGYAQGLPATLNGIVSDQSKAVIPNANVVLKQESTGALRRTVSNADGFFSILGLPAGTYTVTVDASGFGRYEKTGLVFHPGDRISIPDIVLAVAGSTERVEVVGAGADIVPVDTSEKSHTITAAQIQNLSVLGRSADELLKLLPGAVYTNPDDPSTPAGFVVQFNRGIGDYNIAGTRSTQVANLSDGANIIDPGCNCGSAQTPNMDMVAEVKVQTSNFSAENAAGPVVFQAISKSGSSKFHGEGYIYARNSIFNSRDWRNNFFDTKKPQDSFYFPGFNIGGPLTKDRQKLFFFAGVEIQRQNHDLGVRPAVVPTEAMRKGDFSDTAYLNKLNGSDVSLMPMNDQELNASGNAWYNAGTPLTPDMLQGGKINPAAMDKSGQVLVNLMPLPNQDPGRSGGYNYTSNILNPEHRRQALTRIDYNISDNTKLYGKFNQEYQQSPYPFTLWWYNTNDIPYPGNIKGDYNTYVASTSLVKVLDPSTTNETVFGLTRWHMPHKVTDPSKVSRKALGYQYDGMYHNHTDQIPDFTDWGAGVPDFIQPGGLYDPTVFAHKWLASVADNFSKVIGTHTTKFGVFFEYVENTEPTTSSDHGDFEFTNWGGNSTSNAFADMLLGRVGEYGEAKKNIVGDYRKREWSGFAQDSWKATRRLTIEIGTRIQHEGWMYETHGHLFGFIPSLYDPKVENSGLVAPYLGWNGPKSIWATPAIMFSPRFGFAYDLTGHGTTVIRAGGGVFHYLDRNGDSFGAIGNPPLSSSALICCGLLMSELDNLDPLKHPVKSNLTVLEPYASKIPTTYSWSFTISKRLPTQTVLEASYVANSSSHQMGCTNCSMSINAVPEGAMFGTSSTADPNNYRPYQLYGTIATRTHAQSQNYNSFQLTANRQVGRINYTLSYAFQKALGVGGASENGIKQDVFDARRRSYGPLAYDRTQTLTIAYNILLPGKFDNPFLKGMFEGWQTSGISQIQSGAPIYASTFRYSGSLAVRDPENPGQMLQWSDRAITGTPDTPARPVLLCDPRSGLVSGQYANPVCFAAPIPGHNGTYEMPYMKNPFFQNHDISFFKNFEFSESRKLQFRWSLYNFLNHPLPFFMGNDPGLALNFVDGVPDADTLKAFGKTSFKRGRRLMQFALKFYF